MFKKATKAQAKLRAALFGPAGSGKTYSALAIASGLGERIALIDTEHGSAAKYADRFEFDVAELNSKRIEDYIEAFGAAAREGYDVLVVDSLSHAWSELLEEVDRISSADPRGNKWSAWAKATPKQKRLVEAILTYPGHVLATMRSQTQWETEKNSRGKTAPVRVGLKPEQGKDIEYEFDLLLELSAEHSARILKDRTGKFQDEVIPRPGADFGKALASWLADGTPAPKQDRAALKELFTAIDQTAPDGKKADRFGFITETLGRDISKESVAYLEDSEVVLVLKAVDEFTMAAAKAKREAANGETEEAAA